MTRSPISQLFNCALPLTVAVVLSSCTIIAPTTTPGTPSQTGVELDLFTAKAFLGGSDYERYHLKDDVLWRECG